MRSSVVLCVAMSALAAACVAPRGGAKVTQLEVPNPECLLDVDRAFAQLAAEKGAADAFYTYAAEDATLLPAGELPVKGREAIRIQVATSTPGQLKWEPQGAEIASDGNLGYTWGYYEHREAGPDGHAVVSHGKYVTIWRRTPDGLWKFALDIGNPGPPPREESGK